MFIIHAYIINLHLTYTNSPFVFIYTINKANIIRFKVIIFFRLNLMGTDLMHYNLDIFGKEIRKIRDSLNLTQKNVHELLLST